MEQAQQSRQLAARPNPTDEIDLAGLAAAGEPVACDDGEAILYALGLGFGLDPRELPYVYEHRGLRTVPTLLALLAARGITSSRVLEDARIAWQSMSIELFRPPAICEYRAARQVVNIADRDDGFGTDVELETELRRARDDTAIAAIRGKFTRMAPGLDAGARPPGPAAGSLPRRDPDFRSDLQTGTRQALLFRLIGDRHPMYADADAASKAGYAGAVLHDLCVQGLACRAILETVCDYDYTLIGGIGMHFAAPVLHGDVLTTDMWQDGNTVLFRCRVRRTGAIAISHGRCTLNA